MPFSQLFWSKKRKNKTSHRASASTRWHFAFGAIRICSV